MSKLNLKTSKTLFPLFKLYFKDAAEQQSHNHQVRDWLEKLKDAVYEADDLLSEFLTEALRRGGTSENIAKKVRGFFSSSNPLVFRYDMSCKIKAMRQKLNAIAEDRKKFHLKECHVEPHVSMDREETHSFVPNENVFGREDDKKAIIKLLLDPNVEENVSVVPIVGIGGLGKTTLAQYVYNDDIVKKHFELKMWVCVSDPFEVKVVVEKIIASATSNKPNDLHMDELQKQLRKEIDGKKYLLVLDDVWNQNYNKWDNLKSLLMGGAKGSRIIITTRAKLVAEITSPISIYTLNGLSEDQSWSLFEQIAFRKRQETNHPKLVEIGREILGKCQGVPLAIKSIGSVLCLEKTERKWSYVKDSVVANGCDELSHMPRGLGQLTCLQTLPLFIVSNDPPSISNHVGGLGELNRLNNLRGTLEIKHLERLEDGNSESKAANLREKQHLKCLWLRWDRGSNLNANDNDEIIMGMWEMSRSTTVVSTPLSGSLSIRMDDLEYISEKDISEEVPVSSTPFFPLLNSLKISNCPNLKGWWRSAPTPHHQQHQSLPSFPRLSSLKIRDCPNLTSMPLFPNLQEKLDLTNASDDGGSLPDGWASNLISLKSLVIRNYPRLTSMSGAMRYLTSLEELKISGCDEFDPFSDVGAEDDSMQWIHLNCLHTLSFSELPKLESLPAGLQRVTTLKNLTFSDCPNLIGLPEWISEFTSLEYLGFTRCAPNLTSLPDVISCLKSLKKLRIVGFPNLTTFPEWISNFTSLEKLEIEECPNLTSLPYGICYLRFLRHLRIQDCLNLTTFPERISELTSLQWLEIRKCPNLTSLPDGMHGLSSLQRLEISNCPNLTSLPDGMHGLSSLQRLEISRCPNLTSLPDGMHGLSSLQTLRIAGCPNLEKKCEKGIGEDWPKIAHVTHYFNVLHPYEKD
uniref:NB-ARC domain-containing protein n=1 Tax=Fagus sylvatica TaxID=28930 RepID=A0A2N9GNZ1_FAGSY